MSFGRPRRIREETSFSLLVTFFRNEFFRIAAVNQIVSFFHLVDQFADLGRMCLHVIVHAENKVSFGVVECRHQRIVLAEIAQQVDALDILILLTELLDLPIRIFFRGTVVHQDKFSVISVHFLEFFHHHLYNFPDRCLGIVAWDDY